MGRPTRHTEIFMAPALMFLVIVGAITAALLVFDLLALAFGVDSRDAWRR